MSKNPVRDFELGGACVNWISLSLPSERSFQSHQKYQLRELSRVAAKLRILPQPWSTISPLFGIELGSFLKSLDFRGAADEERVLARGGKLSSSFGEDSRKRLREL